MTKLSLSPAGIVRAMRNAHSNPGVDPYNSHDAFRTKAARMIADKARRMRDPYPFHKAG